MGHITCELTSLGFFFMGHRVLYTDIFNWEINDPPAERAKSDTALSLSAADSAHYMLNLRKNKWVEIDVTLPVFAKLPAGRGLSFFLVGHFRKSAQRAQKTPADFAILPTGQQN